jgi:hypothetical protein
MLFGLCVIALAVMFRGSAVGLGSIFVMFGCFIVFVSSHCIPPANVKGKLRKTKHEKFWFPINGPMRRPSRKSVFQRVLKSGLTGAEKKDR